MRLVVIDFKKSVNRKLKKTTLHVPSPLDSLIAPARQLRNSIYSYLESQTDTGCRPLFLLGSLSRLSPALD